MVCEVVTSSLDTLLGFFATAEEPGIIKTLHNANWKVIRAGNRTLPLARDSTTNRNYDGTQIAPKNKSIMRENQAIFYAKRSLTLAIAKVALSAIRAY